MCAPDSPSFELEKIRLTRRHIPGQRYSNQTKNKKANIKLIKFNDRVNGTNLSSRKTLPVRGPIRGLISVLFRSNVCKIKVFGVPARAASVMALSGLDWLRFANIPVMSVYFTYNISRLSLAAGQM